MPVTTPATLDWQHSKTAFVENVGQSPSDARFVSLSLGYTLEITDRGARLSIPSKTSLNLSFDGQASKEKPVAETPVEARFHYYAGKQVRTDVPGFAQVRQPDVYPGIDAVYYGSQTALEYDLIVHPGADPRQIKVRLAGSGAPSVKANGSISVPIGGAAWEQHAPIAYQVIDGQRRTVDARALLEEGVVRFVLGAYDRTHDLVIDPVLEPVATLANRGFSFSFVTGTTIAVGPGGSFAVAASRGKQDSPGLFSITDTNIRIAKFNSTGGLLFLSLIVGEDEDTVNGLAIDTSGSVYAAGGTKSKDLPANDNAFQKRRSTALCNFLHPSDCAGAAADAFALKLTATGQKEWLTYLGSNAFDTATGVALNAARELYVTGITAGSLFPRKNQYQVCRDGGTVSGGSAFLSVLNSTGTDLVYSTCIRPALTAVSGRSSQSHAVAIDLAGNAYITGVVNDTIGSGSFPVQGANLTNPFQRNSNGGTEAFAAKFNPNLSGNASLIYSTLLGGTADETGSSITVNNQGQACIAGDTKSIDFPVRAPAGTLTALNSHRGGSDWFAACINANGSDLLFSNLYGGTGDDTFPSIASDNGANLWLAGFSNSTSLLTVNPLENPDLVGGILLKLAATTREVKLFSASPAFSGIASTGAVQLFSGATVETIQECAPESQFLSIVQGPIVFDIATSHFKQTLTIAHTGPLLFAGAGQRLVFSGLAANVQVVGASGTTVCFEPGTPFLTLPLIPNAAQGGLTLNLEFIPAVVRLPVTYTPRIFRAGVLP